MLTTFLNIYGSDHLSFLNPIKDSDLLYSCVIYMYYVVVLSTLFSVTVSTEPV
jgi:hypothetical protein